MLLLQGGTTEYELQANVRDSNKIGKTIVTGLGGICTIFEARSECEHQSLAKVTSHDERLTIVIFVDERSVVLDQRRDESDQGFVGESIRDSFESRSVAKRHVS